MAKYQVFINSINIYATDNIKHIFFSRNIKNLVVCQVDDGGSYVVIFMNRSLVESLG